MIKQPKSLFVFDQALSLADESAVAALKGYPFILKLQLDASLLRRKIWSVFMPQNGASTFDIEWDLVGWLDGTEMFREKMGKWTDAAGSFTGWVKPAYVIPSTLFQGVDSNSEHMTLQGGDTLAVYPITRVVSIDTIAIHVIRKIGFVTGAAFLGVQSETANIF